MPRTRSARASLRQGKLWRRATIGMWGIAGALMIVWLSSYLANFGFGVGRGTSNHAVLLEVTTVTDGFLVVYNGTRTDNICYDGLTGYGWGPSEAFYLLMVQKHGGRHVLWPRVEHPAKWCGPYTFVPIWMPMLGCVGLGWLLRLLRKHPLGTCSRCGYSRTGLQPRTPCPECGAKPIETSPSVA